MSSHVVKAPGPEVPEAVNLVTLRGRVTTTPEERELPSGDRVLGFRVVVARDRSPMTAKSKQSSDWVDCVAWGGRVRRSVARWRPGDLVDIDGALRRRFFRAEGRTATRVEVEVLGARLVQRSPVVEERTQ